MVDSGAVVAVLLLLLAAVTVGSAVEVVEATERKTLLVLGESRPVLEPGVHFVPPFVSETTRFDVRTQTIDVPPQRAITRDNSPVVADAVVYLRVTDVARARLEVADYHRAVETLTQTTLRAVVGDMELDALLHDRRELNARLREALDEPTDAWGVRVEAVELRELSPADHVQRAMERQSGAERRRRAAVLEAQGERQSAIERAEGERRAAVVRAEGEKRSQILEAQGEAVATVLRARAAESMGERAIVERGLETLAAIGQGESTTVVLPQEFTSLVGRYGSHLTDRDGQAGGQRLRSLSFDDETREFLGLDGEAGSDGDSVFEVLDR